MYPLSAIFQRRYSSLSRLKIHRKCKRLSGHLISWRIVQKERTLVDGRYLSGSDSSVSKFVQEAVSSGEMGDIGPTTRAAKTSATPARLKTISCAKGTRALSETAAVAAIEEPRRWRFFVSSSKSTFNRAGDRNHAETSRLSFLTFLSRPWLKQQMTFPEKERLYLVKVSWRGDLQNFRPLCWPYRAGERSGHPHQLCSRP